MGRPTKICERHIELMDDYIDTCGDEFEKFIKSESNSEKGSSESFGYRLKVELPTLAGLYLVFSKAARKEKNKNLRISDFTMGKWRDDGQELLKNEKEDMNFTEIEELLISFSSSLTELLKLQEKMLLNGGVAGQYGQVITKLILSSNHGYSEKTESKVEHTGQIETIISDEQRLKIAERIINKNKKDD